MPRVDWLVQGLIPRESVFVLFAEEAMGKSLLAYDLAFAVATGGMFLGQQAHEGCVLYFDEENPSNEVARRINALGRGRALQDDPRVAANFYLWRNVLDGKLSDWLADLRAECLTRRPALVVLDTWSSIIPGVAGVENDNALMKRMLNAVRKVVQVGDSRTSLLILHHTSKNPLTADKPRGAGAIVQAADFSAMLALAPSATPNSPPDRLWLSKKVRGLGLKLPDLRVRLHGPLETGPFHFSASAFKPS